MKVEALLLAAALALGAAVQMPADAQRSKRVDPNVYYRAPGSSGGKTIVIPIGTTFEGRISETISSAKSHPGQSFSITMSSPVLANGTDVIIPAGSEILGEVVEAVPSSRLPRKRKMPPPRGKLRVQVSGLRTPDGITYPLVASLIGEEGGRRKTPLGTGVAYMGTASAFEAVGPGMQKVNRGGRRGPEIVSKREMLSHEIFGAGREASRNESDAQIRSLVVRRHDYWIYEGSPLSVKLNAPLKLAVTPPSIGAPLQAVEPEPEDALPPPGRKGGAKGKGGDDGPSEEESRAPARAPAAQPAESSPPPPSPSSDF